MLITAAGVMASTFFQCPIEPWQFIDFSRDTIISEYRGFPENINKRKY